MPYRNNFISFVEKSFLTLREGEPIEGNYLQYCAARLTPLCNKEPVKAILNLPPRHLKTILCAVCVPAWELGQRPASKVLIISGSDGLGSQTLASLQKIMTAPWYKRAFDVEIKTLNSRGLTTSRDGRIKFFAIGGRFTGLGGDIIVVDDLVEIKDAGNLAKLQRVNRLFDDQVMTRLNKPATDRAIVVAHRLSADDLSGHLLNSGTDWEHVKLPLVAPEDENLTAGGVECRRKKGELLRPGLYTDKQLQHLQKPNKLVDFETFQQQNPRGRPFANIDPACIETHPGAVSNLLPRFMSVDPASSTSSGSSCSVIEVWVLFQGKHILIDLYRGQVSFEELASTLNRMCKKHLPALVLIEDNNNAAGLAQKLRSSKFNVVLVRVGGKDKWQRLEPHIPLIQNRGIRLVTTIDRETFIDELTQFPSGKFDDQVDAMTQYLDYVTNVKNHPLPTRRERLIASVTKGSSTSYYSSDGRQKMIYSGLRHDPCGARGTVFGRGR